MTSGLFTRAGEPQALATALNLPYTLTTGQAAGTFLTALAGKRLLGSRCEHCQRVTVPPHDSCGDCGSERHTLLRMPETGSVTAWTQRGEEIIALIRIDGADVDLLHRIVSGDDLEPGTRVRATWAERPTSSILDLAGFAVDAAATSVGEARPAEAPGEVLRELPYRLTLEYRHAYGPYYSRLFDELASERRILGSHCPRCARVLVPPRQRCDVCFVETERFVEVADTGRLQAYSIIHMEFVGQTRKPPYVYAEIVLDGSATKLIHTVAGFDVARAKEILSIGMPVRAVWRKRSEAIGTLDDIEYFEPVSGE
jgi:hypothetical protein